MDRPAVRVRTPAIWCGRTTLAAAVISGASNDHEVDALCRRRVRARLLATVHAIDVLACLRRGFRMAVIAVIIDDPRSSGASSASSATIRGLPPL